MIDDSTVLIPAGTDKSPVAVGETSIEIEGMSCASCVAHVEKAVRAVSGVKEVAVNLARGRAAVSFNPLQTDPPRIADAITHSGYRAFPQDGEIAPAAAEQQRLDRQQSDALAWQRRAIIGIVLWLPLEATHWIMQVLGDPSHHLPANKTWMGWAALISSAIAIVYVGGRFYASALSALRHRTSNMDTLISMGATVAFGYSVIYFIGGMLGAWRPPMGHELFFMEATGLLALISLGHALEARARQSAGSAIRQLLQLAPHVALRLQEGSSTEFAEVSVASVHVGDRLLIRPGDRIPIDGIIIEGRSSIDESMITGESIPVARGVSDPVVGGTINQDGRLIIRVSRVGSQTALAQIVSLVERAQSSKPPVQKLADRISAVFVPSVLAIALLTGIAWYAWGAHMGWGAGAIWAQVAKTVCSVLIIACPCALGLAVPATVMVGAGRGARRGILIRDIEALQKAERIDTVVFDKTGTLTLGRPVVGDIATLGDKAEDEILKLAAAVEQFSSHPLGKAIVERAKERKLSLPKPENFNNDAGRGVTATIDGREILVGSLALLHGASAEFARADYANASARCRELEAGGKTVVFVAERSSDGTAAVIGLIAIVDELKTDSPAAVALLKRKNLHTVLLTGDSTAAAKRVAELVGIDDIRAEVKPRGKAEAIAALQAMGKRVAMVGDGINDAPALATADLGIALGGGSDIAREAGDIILVGGNPAGVWTAIALSRATMRKIRQNLFLAFIYNIIAIPLAAFGLLNPLVAAAAMALSDVTVVGNALLLRRTNID